MSIIKVDYGEVGGGDLTLSKVVAASLTTSSGFTADKDYKKVIALVNASSDVFYHYFTVNGVADTYVDVVSGSADIGSPNISIGSSTISMCAALIYDDIKSGDAFRVSSGSFGGIFYCFE